MCHEEIRTSTEVEHVHVDVYKHTLNNIHNTSAMLSIFGRAGAILLAVVDVSHALYA